ncbi:MAG: macro domain-containing protein, partial [Oscillospiraceae bacterium]|nr:macro domain-containing protein [Oscillospiraceae bacterium]
CYRKCLHKAEELKCKSIAFPLISTGVYGFPKDKALSIATREISAFLEEHDMNVILVVFNRDAYELSKDLVKEVQTFIDENYVAKAFEPEYGGFEPSVRERRNGAHLSDLSWRREKRPRPSEDGLYVTANELEVDSLPVESSKETITGSWPFSKKDGLEEIMRSRSETFQQRLFQLIDEKGYKDVDVYRRAGVDRKLFSKIRSNVDYTPKKRTVLAFAIALRLNMDETTDLLSRAGYAFSPSSKSDLIVQFCIHREIYDIFEVDAILFNYHQQSLTF